LEIGREISGNHMDPVATLPTTNTRRLALQHDVSHSTIGRILGVQQLYLYQVQRVQFLQPGDHARRRTHLPISIFSNANQKVPNLSLSKLILQRSFLYNNVTFLTTFRFYNNRNFTLHHRRVQVSTCNLIRTINKFVGFFFKFR
jgi:hypothetical protein